MDFAPLLADSNPMIPVPENKSQTESKLNNLMESNMLFLTRDFVGLYERFLLVLIEILLKIPDKIFI